MALAVAMTAALGEWLCLQREMQDIQLGSGAGAKCNRPPVCRHREDQIFSDHAWLRRSATTGRRRLCRAGVADRGAIDNARRKIIILIRETRISEQVSTGMSGASRASR